ncbi:hypothetical protein ILUMI_05462 [Ignelater luminosus]|uniref:TM2 domain-containing protein n=1 Tax=Ignelater luminosus TaxID=2038154 RepID=A0A8K0GIM8_IGNLU|nr:hypothetical protein ILUMI_05462 [Ignelater luminosus]
MKCIRINVSNVILILFSFILNNIQQTQMADNRMDIFTKDQTRKNNTNSDPTEPFTPKNAVVDSILPCATDIECNQLEPSCIKCDFNTNCIYGELMNVTCHVGQVAKCKGEKHFHKSLICRYCYQTEPWEHICDLKANCNSAATPRAYYKTNCTVKEHVLCLGNRRFYKNVRCNWTGGYRWSTALIFSITLGGFGADRFYLGHWQEGIGKLFSFGGLGVWTLVDVILISLHYLGPADGSLYI